MHETQPVQAPCLSSVQQVPTSQPNREMELLDYQCARYLRASFTRRRSFLDRKDAKLSVPRVPTSQGVTWLATCKEEYVPLVFKNLGAYLGNLTILFDTNIYFFNISIIIKSQEHDYLGVSLFVCFFNGLYSGLDLEEVFITKDDPTGMCHQHGQQNQVLG